MFRPNCLQGKLMQKIKMIKLNRHYGLILNLDLSYFSWHLFRSLQVEAAQPLSKLCLEFPDILIGKSSSGLFLFPDILQVWSNFYGCSVIFRLPSQIQIWPSLYKLQRQGMYVPWSESPSYSHILYIKHFKKYPILVGSYVSSKMVSGQYTNWIGGRGITEEVPIRNNLRVFSWLTKRVI